MGIYLKQKDRTTEIKHFSRINYGTEFSIQFIGGVTTYVYNSKNVRITGSRRIEISDNTTLFHYRSPIKHDTTYILIDNCYILLNDTLYKKECISFQYFQQIENSDNLTILVNDQPCTLSSIEQSEDYYKIISVDKEITYYPKNEVKLFVDDSIGEFKDYYFKIAEFTDKEEDSPIQKSLKNQINKLQIRRESSLYNFFTMHHKYSQNNKTTIYPFGINLSQRNAIKASLANNFSLIQGPPGTGKTQSILNIIANLLINNQSVAIVSNNNDAVKNIIEKLQKEDLSFFTAFLGNSTNQAVFFENQPSYPEVMTSWEMPESDMTLLLDTIKNKEQMLIDLLEKNNSLAQFKQELLEYQNEYRLFKNYQKGESLQELKLFPLLSLSNTKLSKLITSISNCDEDLNFNFLDKLKYFFNFGITDFRQFENFNEIFLWLQNMFYTQKIKDLENQITELTNYLENNDYNEILSDLTIHSKNYLKSFLAIKYKSQDRPVFEKPSYSSKANFSSFIQEYPVIFSTTQSILRSKEENYLFDYLIVDESSQVDLLSGIIALNSSKNAVIVGDLKQLQHIPKDIPNHLHTQWIIEHKIPDPYNYFQHSLLSSFNTLFNSDTIPSTLLKEHYRCHRKIISFCNKKYYGNQLICHVDEDKEASQPLLLLETVPGNHMRYLNRNENRIINVRELDSIEEPTFLNEANINFTSSETLGLITPFRGQVIEATEKLNKNFQIDTIHKFQGRECDIIFFSPVLDEKKMSQRFLQFVDESRLINVAVSRAKKQFILVSGMNIFRNAKGDIDDLIRHIEYNDENSKISSKVRSVFDLLYSVNKQELQKKKKSWWGSSKWDSENLMYDLLDNIFKEEKYQQYHYARDVRLKELFPKECTSLTTEEEKFINSNSRADIVIYNKYDNQPLVGIEVDGANFHINNPQQLEKDKKKDIIFSKYNLPIIRFPTYGSNEEKKIKEFLDQSSNTIPQT